MAPLSSIVIRPKYAKERSRERGKVMLQKRDKYSGGRKEVIELVMGVKPSSAEQNCNEA